MRPVVLMSNTGAVKLSNTLRNKRPNGLIKYKMVKILAVSSTNPAFLCYREQINKRVIWCYCRPWTDHGTQVIRAFEHRYFLLGLKTGTSDDEWVHGWVVPRKVYRIVHCPGEPIIKVMGQKFCHVLKDSLSNIRWIDFIAIQIACVKHINTRHST